MLTGHEASVWGCAVSPDGRLLAVGATTALAEECDERLACVDVVLDRLREAGYSPSAENSEGAVVVRRPDERRTPPRPRLPRLTGEPPAATEAKPGLRIRA